MGLECVLEIHLMESRSPISGIPWQMFSVLFLSKERWGLRKRVMSRSDVHGKLMPGCQLRFVLSEVLLFQRFVVSPGVPLMITGYWGGNSQTHSLLILHMFFLSFCGISEQHRTPSHALADLCVLTRGQYKTDIDWRCFFWAKDHLSLISKQSTTQLPSLLCYVAFFSNCFM